MARRYPTLLRAAAAAGMAGAVALAVAPGRTEAQSATTSQWAGIYTQAQVGRGEPLYVENCQPCHGADLAGTISAPALSGAMMAARGEKSLADLFEYVQIFMPWNSPGGLSPAQNADILAFVFSKAGFPAGTSGLPVDRAAQERIRILPGPKPQPGR